MLHRVLLALYTLLKSAHARQSEAIPYGRDSRARSFEFPLYDNRRSYESVTKSADEPSGTVMENKRERTVIPRVNEEERKQRRRKENEPPHAAGRYSSTERLNSPVVLIEYGCTDTSVPAPRPKLKVSRRT